MWGRLVLWEKDRTLEVTMQVLEIRWPMRGPQGKMHKAIHFVHHV
jgi:hypothetical protein